MYTLKALAVVSGVAAVDAVSTPVFGAWERFGVAGVFLALLITVWLDSRQMRKEILAALNDSTKAIQQSCDSSYQLRDTAKELTDAVKQCRRANP